MNRTTQGGFNDKSTLRTGRIIFHLQKLTTAWEPVVDPPSGAPRVVRMGQRDLTGGVKERLEEVVEAVEVLKEFLGNSTSWEEIAAEVLAAPVDATQTGIEEDFRELYNKLDLLDQYPPISEYQGLLEGTGSPGANVGENLLIIGNSEKLRPLELRQLLETISGAFSQVIRNGEQRLGITGEKSDEDSQSGESPLKEFKKVVQKLLVQIGELR